MCWWSVHKHASTLTLTLQVLVETGGLCTSTGMNLVQYEISVEQLVLTELDTVLKVGC